MLWWQSERARRGEWRVGEEVAQAVGAAHLRGEAVEREALWQRQRHRGRLPGPPPRDGDAR
ncbi:hypothetical protein CCS92_34400, partial [Methylobacterium radiotolerans]